LLAAGGVADLTDDKEVRMSSLHLVPVRVACYARVSTEDQAERQTIAAQTDFLRRYCDLHGLYVAGVYVDDGVSGATPLEDRPEGRRLLEDAESGAFTVVLVYRLDRLGRSLKSLLAAHERLDAAGVAIRSGTEPFDTASPIGKFLFSLLGSMAELERATINERLTMGRDRVARGGKWTGGPVPFGYDLDAAGCLIRSERVVEGTGHTEWEIVAGIFKRVAEGATVLAECRRMDALGVPCELRYAGGATRIANTSWKPNRLHFILKNTGYFGYHVVKSKNGTIEREIPPLVDREIWDAAQAAMARNRRLSTRNAKMRYLLRGLITCACGRGYTGSFSKYRSGKINREYRCTGQLVSASSITGERCRSKILSADTLEDAVWQDCRRFIEDPGRTLQDAQNELRKRMGDTVNIEGERRRLTRLLAEKEAERERVMTLFRRGRATIDDVEQQLDAIQGEAIELRGQLDTLRAQQEVAAAYEAHYAEARALLLRLRERVEAIEAEDDWETKRSVVEMLVTRIRAKTIGEGRRKSARVTIGYAFAPQQTVNVAGPGKLAPSRPPARCRTGR
jgi:site-specific DNA recombinase